MVTIAEYYGQRTDSLVKIAPKSQIGPCKFAPIKCSKLSEGYKPICAVRRGNDFWMVCRHRLCSSSGDALSSYQQDILLQISKEVFGKDVLKSEIAYKKEVPLPIKGTKSTYHGDFVLAFTRTNSQRRAPSRLFVEMQGGGETSSTGAITRHVSHWESDPNRNNSKLAKDISKVGIIQTNAWRRQQEQLLLKGNIAAQSGYGIVLCTGNTLYEYIRSKLNNFSKLPDLRNARWDFALLAFDEIPAPTNYSGPIKLKLAAEKSLFTSFHALSSALITQGEALPEVFVGKFTTLSGETKILK